MTNNPSDKVNKKNISESSAYYENSKHNVIEEYNNKNNKKINLPILNETEIDMGSSENKNIKNNKDKNYKYFSHLNV